jgi:hypothetical protein
LVRIDPIEGDSTDLRAALRRRLERLDYVSLTQDDCFDCLVRGRSQSGGYAIRAVNRVGDATPLEVCGNIDELGGQARH